MKLQNYQTEQKIMHIEIYIQGLTPTMIYLLSTMLLSCSIGCSYLRVHFIHNINKSKTWSEEEEEEEEN